MEAFCALNDSDDESIGHSVISQHRLHSIEAKVKDGLALLEKSAGWWTCGNDLDKERAKNGFNELLLLHETILSDSIMGTARAGVTTDESEISGALLKLHRHTKEFLRVFNRIYGMFLLKSTDKSLDVLSRVCFHLYIVLCLNPKDTQIWEIYGKCLQERGLVNSAANAYYKAIQMYEKSQKSMGLACRFDSLKHPVVACATRLLDMYEAAGNVPKAWALLQNVSKKSSLHVWNAYRSRFMAVLALDFWAGTCPKSMTDDAELLRALVSSRKPDTLELSSDAIVTESLESNSATDQACQEHFLTFESNDALYMAERICEALRVRSSRDTVRCVFEVDMKVSTSPHSSPTSASSLLRASIEDKSDGETDFEVPEANTRELRKKSNRALAGAFSQSGQQLSQDLKPSSLSGQEFTVPPLPEVLNSADTLTMEEWRQSFKSDTFEPPNLANSASGSAPGYDLSAGINVCFSHQLPSLSLGELACYFLCLFIPEISTMGTTASCDILFAIFELIDPELLAFTLSLSNPLTINPPTPNGSSSATERLGMLCYFVTYYYRFKAGVRDSSVIEGLLGALSAEGKRSSAATPNFQQFLTFSEQIKLARTYAHCRTLFLECKTLSCTKKQLLLATECELVGKFHQSLYHLQPVLDVEPSYSVQLLKTRLQCYLFLSDMQEAAEKRQESFIVAKLLPILFSPAASHACASLGPELASQAADLLFEVYKLQGDQSQSHWMLYMTGQTICHGRQVQFSIDPTIVCDYYWNKLPFDHRHRLRSLFKRCVAASGCHQGVLERVNRLLDCLAFVDMVHSWNDKSQFFSLKCDTLAEFSRISSAVLEPLDLKSETLSFVAPNLRSVLCALPESLQSAMETQSAVALQFVLLAAEHRNELLEERAFKNTRVSPKKQEERKDVLAASLLNAAIIFLESKTGRLLTFEDTVAVLERTHALLYDLDRCGYSSGLLHKYAISKVCGSDSSPLRTWWTLHLFTCASGCPSSSMSPIIMDGSYCVGHMNAQKSKLTAVDGSLVRRTFKELGTTVFSKYITELDFSVQWLNAARDVAEAFAVSLIPMCKNHHVYCHASAALQKYFSRPIDFSDLALVPKGLQLAPMTVADAKALGQTLTKGPEYLAQIMQQSLLMTPKRERSVARMQVLRELWMLHLCLNPFNANAWISLGNVTRDLASIYPGDRRRTTSQSLEYYKCLVCAYRCYRQYLALVKTPEKAEVWHQLCILGDLMLRAPVNGDVFFLYSPFLTPTAEMDAILGYTRYYMGRYVKEEAYGWIVGAAATSSVSSTMPEYGKMSEPSVTKGDLFDDVLMQIYEARYGKQLEKTREWIQGSVKPKLLAIMAFAARELIARESNMKRNSEFLYLVNRHSIELDVSTNEPGSSVNDADQNLQTVENME